MKIGIVIGSIREGRKGADVGNWVAQRATEVTDVTFEVLDLKEFDLPFMTSATLPAMANRQYESDSVTRWSQAVDSCDGFIFVTPEYNYGLPGAFKNAIDSLGPEWGQKTVGFVSYGGDGGHRATAQWRQVVANFEMLDVRATVALSIYRDFDETGFAPQPRRPKELSVLLDQLISLTRKINAQRETV